MSYWYSTIELYINLIYYWGDEDKMIRSFCNEDRMEFISGKKPKSINHLAIVINSLNEKEENKKVSHNKLYFTLYILFL